MSYSSRVMVRYLALCALVFSGCKKKDELGKLDATAAVEGFAVVITATCTNFESIDAEGVNAPCANGKVRLELPTATLAKGPQTIKVRSSDRNGMTISLADVTVDVTAVGQLPYFRIAECRTETGDDATYAILEVGDRKTDCKIPSDAHAKLVIEANPGGKLTIGGATVAVPDTGTLTQSVDLVPYVLALSLDQLTGDKRVASTFTMAYSLSVGDKTASGTIALVETAGYEGSVARLLLHKIGEGKMGRPAFKPGRGIAGVIMHDGKLVVIGTGTVGNLAIIATERETATTENGTCDYKVDNKLITAKRFLVDIEETALNLTDGSIEKKTLESSRDPENCPMFEVMDPKDPKATARVPADVIASWLGAVAVKN